MKKFLTMVALMLVVVMSVALLTACGVDMDNAKQKLEDADYKVIVVGDGEKETGDYEGVVRMLTATDIGLGNLLSANAVTILQFNDKEARDEVFAELDGSMEGYECKVSGMCIVFGTEEAVDIVL